MSCRPIYSFRQRQWATGEASSLYLGILEKVAIVARNRISTFPTNMLAHQVCLFLLDVILCLFSTPLTAQCQGLLKRSILTPGGLSAVGECHRTFISLLLTLLPKHTLTHLTLTLIHPNALSHTPHSHTPMHSHTQLFYTHTHTAAVILHSHSDVKPDSQSWTITAHGVMSLLISWVWHLNP